MNQERSRSRSQPGRRQRVSEPPLPCVRSTRPSEETSWRVVKPGRRNTVLSRPERDTAFKGAVVALPFFALNQISSPFGDQCREVPGGNPRSDERILACPDRSTIATDAFPSA